MRAARRSASAAPLLAVPTPHVLDRQGCIDKLAALVFDGVFSAGQGRYWRAILERVDVDTRIVQPGGASDDLPSELAELAGVDRCFHFRFCNVMGPDLKSREPVGEHHLLLRQRVYPNATFPVDGRETSSGGQGLVLLFGSPEEFDRRARLKGDRSRIKATPVASTRLESHRGDSSRLNATPSIFMASQTERDRDDPAVESRRSLSLSPPEPSFSPPPPHGSARERARAAAPEAPGLATASPGAMRTSLREGVSRHQSTALSQGADASREGQKSRGSSALAEAHGASDDELRTVHCVLNCWADLFGRNREDAYSPAWVAILLRWMRMGLAGWELVKVLGGAKENPGRFESGSSRSNVEFIFASRKQIDACRSLCRESFWRHLCAKYGVAAPPRPKNAPKGQPGANAQGAGNGLDGTERAMHSFAEGITKALNEIDVSYGTRTPRPGGFEKGSKP